ncbi:hypothetical protein ACA910_005007 [Epithemia clementina (nom. ined.)]
MKALIDTPQFQRLRYLKQLGTSNNVFMCGNHTRFEHSIGVARLAQRVCEGISARQPSLVCSAKDILCVKLAGLLHDIGHGPFSHVFESFVQKAFPAYFKTLDTETQDIYKRFPEMPSGKWGHEKVSLNLIDAALAHLGLAIDLDNLDAPLKEIGDSGIDATTMRSYDVEDGEVLTSRDFVFIKECIWGRPIPDIEDSLGRKGFAGRVCWKYEWMYDIVANRHSGLDVDKIDYFARDSRRCFGDGRVDEVIVEESCVAWGECTDAACKLCGDSASDRPHHRKHLMVCFPTKMVKAAITFFNKRFELHSTIYFHKTTRALGHMVCDILCKADPYFRLSTSPYAGHPTPDGPGRKSPSLPISRAMMDGYAFIRLRDSIIEEIANSTQANMEEASHLAGRFLVRDLYKCIFDQGVDERDRADKQLWSMSEEEIIKSFMEFMAGYRNECNDKENTLSSIHNKLDHVIVPEDILIDKFIIHHGQKDRNPIENIRVVSDKTMKRELKVTNLCDLPVAGRPDIDHFKAQTPIEQQQKTIRVYCRTKAKCSLLGQSFRAWVIHHKAHWQILGSGIKNAAVFSQMQTPVQFRLDMPCVDADSINKDDVVELTPDK